MRLYIQIENGQPLGHPILEDNFCAAFPGIDPDNLPSTFARFVRVAAPQIGPWEAYEGVTYEWVGDVVQDVHHVRPLTQPEIEQRMAEYVGDRILLAEEMRDAATEENKTYWQAYINDLRAVTIPYSGFSALPSPPQFSASGEYINVPAIGVSRV